MTTGEPQDAAQVINSGTDQDAVFDFVIPRGVTGTAGTPVEIMTAYSIPPQPGTSGSGLVFDRNGVQAGSEITHIERSSTFTIQGTGYYYVSFHGTLSPGIGTNLPLAVNVYLREAGTIIPGAGVNLIFRASTDVKNIAFSHIIQVVNAGTVLDVIGEGGNFLYTQNFISIYKIG